MPKPITIQPQLNCQSVLQHWPEALFALDEHLCVAAVSSGARAILGNDDGMYIGKHVHDALCVETRGYAHNKTNCLVCKNILNHDSAKVTSTWWKNTRGDNVSLDFHIMYPENLSEIKYLISFVDNKTRTHNQEELERYAEYIDKTPSPIAELDVEATILFSNSAMNKKFVQHGFAENGYARVFPNNIKYLCSQCLAENSNIECVEVAFDNFCYSWNFYPLNSSHNTVLAWMNDVSEKRRMEESLRTEQSAARRDFYAKMVHELRTPINAIVGFSNILLVSDTEKYSTQELDMLERIYHGGLELADLISDTLDASKIEAGKMDITVSQFNLCDLIKQVQAQLNVIAFDKALKLTTECNPALEISSDKNKVKQIINNILSNALKYTEEGDVSLVVSERQKDSIEIVVSDTGIGMRQEELYKVFGNYQRVGSQKNHEIQGTGLGLALVKELVDMLKGNIDVKSSYGEGSTFTVILPLSIDQNAD